MGAADTLVGSMPVVVMDPGRRGLAERSGTAGRSAVGPFAQASLDEAFGLAVGLRPVGSGEVCLMPAPPAGL